jgi:putative Ca2+/H+ antiporter (TMEM165/GDT1 family)
MLATVTLATEHGPVGTSIGSTLGIVAAGTLAIGVGQQLGARPPVAP